VISNEVHGQEIRIGVDEGPPFASQTVPLHQEGLSVEILGTVFKAAGYTPTIKILPWPRVIKGLERGSFDVIGNLWYTVAIAEWVIYSQPYHHSHLKFITSKNNTIAFETLNDLKPYSIGIGIGYTTNTDFDTSTELKKIEIPLASNGMKMILLGRLDMVLDSEEVFLYLLCHDFRKTAGEFKILEKALIPSPIYVGAAKENPRGKKLIHDFNFAYAQLNEEGVIQEIIKHHMKYIQCQD
jgi:polar amino acid transport system substrate-binding protein